MDRSHFPLGAGIPPVSHAAGGAVTTRISGGIHRGRPLKTPSAPGLRPTSERVRAALFSIIGPEAVESKRVADLYAGTGALGLDALSRGAAWVSFVERNGRLCATLRGVAQVLVAGRAGGGTQGQGSDRSRLVARRIRPGDGGPALQLGRTAPPDGGAAIAALGESGRACRTGT